MKVGIITFHRAINYGGVLQSYALQRYIENKGVSAEVIDYRSPFIEKQYYSKKINFKYIKRVASAIIKNGTLKPPINEFIQFRKNYLKVSSVKYNLKNIQDSENEYDILITGSDQVWSYYCAGFDENYFLNFINNPRKKFSYAASFGVERIPSEFNLEYKKRLINFNSISVREKSGQKLIKNLIDRSSHVHIDPTLLFDFEGWKKILDIDINSFKNKKKYILIYMIAESKSIIKSAKRLAKQEKLEIFYISDRIYKKRGLINLRKVDPKKWVELFNNASYVFTNSFHGVAFSINFKKDFYIEFLKNNVLVNTRLNEILSDFGLKDRIINNDIKFSKIHKDRYTDIQKVLKIKRNQSNKYINGIIRK